MTTKLASNQLEVEVSGSTQDLGEYLENRHRRSLKDSGATGDGIADDFTAFFNANNSGDFLVPAGTYLIGSNITISSNMSFVPGAILRPAIGVTITLQGAIEAGNYKIFDTSLGGSFTIAPVHKIKEIPITWFGALSGDLAADATNQVLADSNMKAIKDAVATSDLGIPAGIYRSPIVRIPVGLYFVDDDDSDGIGVSVPAYAVIKGEGFNSVIRPKNNAREMSIFAWDVDDAGNIIMDDMQIYGEASEQTAIQHAIDINPPTGPIIYSYIGRGVMIKEMNGHGIVIRGQGIDNSTIEPFQVRDSTQHNLLVTACDRLTVQNGIYRTAKAGNSGAVFDGAGCLSAIIRNNQFDENNTHGLLVSNVGGRFDVSNNRCASNFTGNGIYLDRCDNTQAENNQCEQNGNDGILVDNCDDVQVNGNYSRGNARFGIIFGGTANSSITNNHVLDNGASSPGTYDGVNIQSNSDNNNVQGNTVRNAAGHQRYGLSIEDTFSNDNFVTNNDLLNSGSVGAFNDAGTGTITVAGNRT